MARIISDPINSYRGRIGKISYYIRKCENMARKSSSAGKISASPAAVAQRTKFGKLIKLSQALAPAITLGFPQRKRGQSPANAFMSLNKGICTLEDDTLTVDYEQLQCAQGSLTEPDITATYNTSTSKITFENTAMEGLAYCNADDKTYGVKCPPVVYINTIIKYLKYYIMKVKDFINGQFQGRHNNLIFYTRGNNTYVRRYAIPGKKRKWETEGRTPKQQAVAIRFKAVQVFYMTFAKQVSPEIWRAVAKTVGRHAPNVFFSRNFHCFGEEGQIADFGNFMFTDGTLPLPRNLEVSGEGPLFKVTWQEERMWKTVSGTDRLQIGVLYCLLYTSDAADE